MKATFWFVPVLIILIAILLAVGFVSIDGFIIFSEEGLGRFFIVNRADSAHSKISILSGIMMGVVGTVFPVTVLSQ